jgi:hypothetical protein
VYVAWIDDISGNSEVLFKGSTNKGVSFGGTKNLSNKSDNPDSIVISSSSSSVYIGWREQFPGDIMFKRSTDKGSHFGSTINLSHDAIDSGSPRFSRDGDNLNVVWEGGDILFRRSIDKGASFGNIENLSNSPNESSFEPDIASSNGNVYVVWRESIGDQSKIFFRGPISQFALSNSSHTLLPLPYQ